MKFRQYLTGTGVSLVESDLLGVSSGASSTDTSGSASVGLRHGPPQGSQADGVDLPPESTGSPLGSGRAPDEMDDQLRQAGTLAADLLKILTGLPHPFNRRYHVFVRALRGLIDKLGEIS